MKPLTLQHYEKARDTLAFEPRFPLIDSHIHLDSEPYHSDWQEVWKQAQSFGVVAAVMPATNLASSQRILQMCQSNPQLFAGVGIHPHQAQEFCPTATPPQLRTLAQSAVAIGETGLEGHYDFCPWEAQLNSLRFHLKLAKELQLPLILHCRESEEALYRELSEAGPFQAGGVVHCYTGSWEYAEKFLGLGFHLGVNGLVTLATANNVHEVVQRMPLERMLLETDGPYLTPRPFRGFRNEPALVSLACQSVAQLRQMEPESVAQATSRNSKGLFRLPLEV